MDKTINATNAKPTPKKPKKKPIIEELSNKINEIDTSIPINISDENNPEVNEINNNEISISNLAKEFTSLKESIENIDSSNIDEHSIKNIEHELNEAFKKGEEIKEKLEKEIKKINNSNFTNFWNGVSGGY